MNDDVKQALQTLRDSGIHVPRKLLSQANKKMPPIRTADKRRFRDYCELSWKNKIRFVVGWGGAAGSDTHLTFHTMEGFEGRRAHAKTMRLKGNVVAAPPVLPPKRKEGYPATDVRQPTSPQNAGE